MKILLKQVLRQDNTLLLEMTAFDGAEQEVFCQPIAEQTAQLMDEVLAERPFKTTQPGLYDWEILGILEGPGMSMKVIIRKGRTRVSRTIPIVAEKSLFLIVWNLFHYQALPSKLPEKKRFR